MNTPLKPVDLQQSTDNPPPLELRQRVAELHHMWGEQHGFRQHIARLVRFADGDQIEHGQGNPNEPQWHLDQKPRYAPNLLDDGLTKLSYLYTTPAQRKSEQAEAWREALWDHGLGLDAILLDADKHIRLCGTVLALALPDYDGGEVQGVHLSTLTPDRWVAATDDMHRHRISSLAVYWETRSVEVTGHNNDDTEGAVSRRIKTMDVHHYWDGVYFARLHDWKIVGWEKHNLGGVPACTLKNTISPLSLFGRPLGGADLVRNIMSINKLWDELLYTASLQRGQPVGDPTIEATLGPDVIVKEREAGSFRILANNANLAGMESTLLLALAALGKSWGLPSREFALRMTGTITGAAIVADRGELAIDRAGREPIAREWERCIAQIASMVWQASGKSALPPWSVRHMVGDIPTSHSERLAEADFRLSNGLATRETVARMFEPGLTDDELAKMLEEASNEAETLAQLRAWIAGHAEPEQDEEMLQIELAERLAALLRAKVENYGIMVRGLINKPSAARIAGLEGAEFTDAEPVTGRDPEPEQPEPDVTIDEGEA